MYEITAQSQQQKTFQKMKFDTISPDDPDYNRTMMKKHLQLKKYLQQRQTYKKSSTINRNTNRILNNDPLPAAGKSLLNNGHHEIVRNNTVSPNRSNISESEKMKRLNFDNMQESMRNYQKMKKDAAEEHKKTRKTMQTENGVLDYLQKEIQKRDNFIRMCLEKQQLRRTKFIDEDLRKHTNALQHIQQNYDENIFNHQTQKYKNWKKYNTRKVAETVNQQLQSSRVAKTIQRSQYGQYLDERYVGEQHNPITNPKPYHIENPYIRRQIDRY